MDAHSPGACLLLPAVSLLSPSLTPCNLHRALSLNQKARKKLLPKGSLLLSPCVGQAWAMGTTMSLWLIWTCSLENGEHPVAPAGAMQGSHFQCAS
jgi:hypothetical protein